MAQTLKLTNFSDNNIVEQTQLTAAANAAANALTVADAQDFTSGYVLIGAKGTKTSEVLPNTSVTSGTNIAITSPTVLYHNQYTPVYALFGNQLKIYRAANVDGSQPADTAFTSLATVTIDPNDEVTTYLDANGGGNYWYKYTFFNQGSSAETALADAVAVRGSFTTNYCSLDEIREEAGFKYAVYVSDTLIDQKRQAAQDEINGALDEFYATPLQPPINDYLKRIAIRLAAGYLRLGQYSQISDTKVNGQDMVDSAQADLHKLIMKERVLVGKDGKALDGPGASGGVDGWPNSSTDTTPGSSGGAPRVFRMSNIQGQPLAIDNSGNPVGNLYYGRKW